MKVNNPLEYQKYFNVLLEYCKTKYDMPKDKMQRLDEFFKSRYNNWIESRNNVLKLIENNKKNAMRSKQNYYRY